jgi:hypothetical protein
MKVLSTTETSDRFLAREAIDSRSVKPIRGFVGVST